MRPRKIIKDAHRPGSLRIVILIVALLLSPFEAAAAKAIIHVEGANAATLAAEIREALPAGTTVADSKRFDAVLGRDGRVRAGRALASGKGVGAAAERVERALGRAGGDVAIFVTASRAQRGDRTMRVLVVSAGQPDKHYFNSSSQKATASRAERVRWWSEVLAEAFAQASVVPPSEPAGKAAGTSPSSSSNAAAPASNDANDASASPLAAVSPPASSAARASDPGPSGSPNAVPPSNPTKDAAPASLASDESRDTAESAGRMPSSGAPQHEDWRIAISLESSLRRFEDSEANERAGRLYKASPVPGFSIGGEMYPLANGRIGLGAAYARSVGVQSLTQDGRVVGTSWSRVEAAARYRFPTASHENAPWVALFGGYAYSGFVFEREPPQREIPRAEYHMARLGLDVRVPIDRVVAIVGAEGNWLFDIAPLGNVAAQSGGAGVTGRLAFGYRVTRWLIVRADGRYARMWFGLREGDSGVLDQYLTAGLGVEATF